MSVLTIFRSRLRPGVHEEYGVVARRMEELVATMDGFEGHWFYANGAERVTIVRFRDEASQAAWARHPEHRAAQELGRRSFYDFYDVSVGIETLHHEFHAEEGTTD